MSKLNGSPAEYSPRLQENLRDIPYAINAHLLDPASPLYDVLHEKQRELMGDTSATIFEGNFRAVALLWPTSTGKTIAMSCVLAALKRDEQFGQRRRRTLYLTTTKEGVKQTRDKIKKFAKIDAGVYYDEEKNIEGKDVIVATYASWLDPDFPVDPEDIDIVVMDEGHKAITDQRLEKAKLHKNALLVAMTGSPEYGDQRSVLDHFELAGYLTVREAVESGLSCSFRNIVLDSNIFVNFDTIDVVDENYSKGQLGRALNTEARNRIGAEYLLFGRHPDTGEPIRDLPGLVSCINVDHAKDYATCVNKLYEKHFPGQAPEYGFIQPISGYTKNRHKLLEWQEEGKIGYLAFADLLLENFDAPYLVVQQNLRPTPSPPVVIQRGGRPGRLNKKNRHKIGLIVDTRDDFEEGALHNPLLYAQAIGEIAIITEEAAAQAQILRSAIETMNPPGRPPSLSLEDRELLHKVQMRLHTDEQDILSIIKDNVRLPRKTEHHLIATEVAELIGRDAGTIRETFTRIRTETVLHQLDPLKYPPPKVDLVDVLYFGRSMPALFKDQYDDFVLHYSDIILLDKKTEKHLSVTDIINRTERDRSTIDAGFRRLDKHWEEYEADKENVPKPLIDPKKVAYKGKPLAVILSEQLDMFLAEYCPVALLREANPDELTVTQLSEMTGHTSGTIRKNLLYFRNTNVVYNKLVESIAKSFPDTESDRIPPQKELMAYLAEIDKIPKPLFMPEIVTVTGRPTLAIPLSQGEAYKTYCRERFPQEKTDSVLMLSELEPLTGLPRKTIETIFQTIRAQTRLHNSDSKKYPAPSVKLSLVLSEKHRRMTAIPADKLKTFLEDYCAPYLSRPKQKGDLLVPRLEKETGYPRKILQAELETFHRQGIAHRFDKKNYPAPAISPEYVTEGEGSEGKIAISQEQLPLLQEHLAKIPGIIRNKIKGDLSKPDLEKRWGVSHLTIRRSFKKLHKDWEKHNHEPGKYPVPKVKIACVKSAGKEIDSITESEEEEFKKGYCAAALLRKIQPHDVMVPDLAGITGLPQSTLYRIVQRSKKACEAYKAKKDAAGKTAPEFCFQKVTILGKPGDILPLEDVPAFLGEFCPEKMATFFDNLGQIVTRLEQRYDKKYAPKAA
jgi:superfamily II DNA or RNA helicase